MKPISESLGDLVYKSYITNWAELLLKYIDKTFSDGDREAWERISRIEWRNGRSWIKENQGRLGIRGDDINAGIELVRLGLQTFGPGLYSRKEYDVNIEDSYRARIIIYSWSPLIEACKRIGMDPNLPLENILKPRLLAILQSINPKFILEIGGVDLDQNRLELILILEE